MTDLSTPEPVSGNQRPDVHAPGAGLPVRVVLVHWNQPHACAAAVRRFLESGLLLELTVVDNGSSAGNYRSLRDLLPRGVGLIRVERNLGWGGGLNVALRHWLEKERTPYCFVAPHDALPVGDCLGLLLNSLDGDEGIGIVSPEPSGGGLTPAYSPIRGPRLSAGPVGPAGSADPAAFPNGTLMAFRRACLQDIGLFDERYFTYGEEIEIGLRARLRGWQVAVVRGARVDNPGCGSPRQVVHYLLSRNSLIMARVYGGRFRAFVRSGLMLANTLLIALSPPARRRNFSASARARAVWDYLMGRDGPPPAHLLAE